MYKVKLCSRQVHCSLYGLLLPFTESGRQIKKKNRAFQEIHAHKKGICRYETRSYVKSRPSGIPDRSKRPAKTVDHPALCRVPFPEISPLDVYTGTRNGYGFLLESMEGSEKIARYSYIGIDPEFVVTIGQDRQIYREMTRLPQLQKIRKGDTR